MKRLRNSDCDIRNYFLTVKKSVENEGIQDKSIAIVTLDQKLLLLPAA